MLQEVHLTPRPSDRLSLASGQVACAALTETVLKTVHLRGNCYAYLQALALDAEAGATGYIEFRAYLGGALVSRWWGKRSATLGAIGNPVPVGEELPNGSDLELRAYNSHATSSFNAFTDGEVTFYDQPLR